MSFERAAGRAGGEEEGTYDVEDLVGGRFLHSVVKLSSGAVVHHLLEVLDHVDGMGVLVSRMGQDVGDAFHRSGLAPGMARRQ